MSDGCSSPRLDVYGHTLQEIEPELSTFRVDRQEGQKGQVILVFSDTVELFEIGSSLKQVALLRIYVVTEMEKIRDLMARDGKKSEHGKNE